MVAQRIRRTGLRGVLALAAAFGALAIVSAASAEAPRAEFSVDKVLVNQTGGITVKGTVDCSPAVLDKWGSFSQVPDGTQVVVNVDWTANQPAGRKMLRAELQDDQASPCWANDTEFLDPGRCVEASPGVWYPCKWDSSNYGSSGWVYGNGKFGTARTHVDAVLSGGFWGDADLGETFDFFQVKSVDVKPIRVRTG